MAANNAPTQDGPGLVCRALIFLRVVDLHDSMVSLTNVALWVALVKLAWVRNASVVDLATLMTALLAYSGKKWLAGKAAEENTPAENPEEVLKPLTDRLGAVEATAKTWEGKLDALVGSLRLSGVSKR